jgi:TetR/AcrR family transcriptional repressor of nem operon
MSSSTTTFDAILACARSLIVAGGYNGFSYADIAAVVGIRKASIHHHFPTKVDLVRTLVARYREEARTGMAALEAQLPDPPAQLRAYTGYWQSCITDASAPICICALLASEIPILPADVVTEVRAHFTTLSTWLASRFAQGVGEGSIRVVSSPEVDAELFMATVHGAMLSARAYGEPAMFGTVVAPLLERMIVPSPA